MKVENMDAVWALTTVNEMVALGIIENTVERRAYMLDSLFSILAQAGEAGTAGTTKIGPVHEHAVGNADAPKVTRHDH